MINLTKQEYLELPVGWTIQQHVEINRDIVDSSFEVMFNEQMKVIEEVLQLVSDDPEEDDNIDFHQYDEFICYSYKDDVLLEIDTMIEERGCVMVFQYKINRVEL